MLRKMFALGILMMFCFAAALAEESEDVRIQVLLTSDLHGSILDSDYTVDGAESMEGSGLSRIASLIREYRKMNPNTLLIDDGDVIQGSPLTYYYAFQRNDVTDPAMKALRMLQYDAFVPGNHEFNYGLEILNRQLGDLTAPAVPGETPVPVLAANFLKRGSEDYTPWQQAYTVKEIDGVKVGLIGFGNPATPWWDKPENWSEIDFRTFLDAWEHYASILKEEEQCDIVIACCHSGLGTLGGNLTEAEDLGPSMNGKGLYYENSYDGQIAAMIENSTGIDLVLGGHTHEKAVFSITNREGKEIPVLHCGRYGCDLGVAELVWNRENGLTAVTCDTVNAEKAEPDAEFVAVLAEYETCLWNEYLHEEIGNASGDFPGPGNLTEPSAFLDLICQMQLETTGAQMTFSAPLTRGAEVLIPEGAIRLGQMFQLYTYENWLYNINMTGQEIREWLEFAATKYDVREDGSIVCDLIYCDTLYGEGVSYEIWLGNKPGDRVRNLMWQGKPMNPEETFQVAVNDYRFGGGGNYIRNISTMKTGDMSRVNFSTQYDLEHGDDDGQARNLLAEYIREKGTIDPVVTGGFHVYPGASEDP